jgi:hypothetical protein
VHRVWWGSLRERDHLGDPDLNVMDLQEVGGGFRGLDGEGRG